MEPSVTYSVRIHKKSRVNPVHSSILHLVKVHFYVLKASTDRIGYFS
jgi:hypothetical protein